MFLPVEQEVARRRGHELGSATFDPTLIRRVVRASLAASAVVGLIAVAAYPLSLRLLDGNWYLLAAFCVALPGYACCYASRGVFAGSKELGRYGLQMGVEGGCRLLGILPLLLVGWHSVAAVGWLYGLAPWIALGASFIGRRVPLASRREGVRLPRPGAASDHRGRHRRGVLQPATWRAGARNVTIVRGDALVSALGLLLVSSVAAQLLINAGPLIVQLLATPAERARAGAFLAALVMVRIPIFLFTAVQPSFLPAMATHAATDRKAEFVRLVRRVLMICLGVTIVSTIVATALGSVLLRFFFGFSQGLSSGTFLAMSLAIGLFLAAIILAQAVLGRGKQSWTTAGWLTGLAALLLGTFFATSAVGKATSGFLSGAVAAACTFAVLLAIALHRWRTPQPAITVAARQSEVPARQTS
jgi:O-antigen/teichoic acid export membrane protein